MRGLKSLNFMVIYHYPASNLVHAHQQHTLFTQSQSWSEGLSEAVEQSASHRVHGVDKTRYG